MMFLRYGSLVDKIKAKVRGTIDVDQLIKDGLIIGENFHAQDGVIIDPGHCWLIEIGDNVTLAPRVHILAHDASTKFGIGYTKIGCVTIGNDVFVGAGSIILPGVTIPDKTIIGAGSLVTKSLPHGGVFFGTPVKYICAYEEYISKHNDLVKKLPVFEKEYIIGNITSNMKVDMKMKVKQSDGGYVV